MTIIRVVDFETTGIPTPEDKHAMVEAGWCDLIPADGGGWRIVGPMSSLVNPGRAISLEAMAVHHLRDCDVADAASPTDICRMLADGADIFCAHNMDFDSQFFGGGDKPWICTYKSALRLWPEAPSHKNQVLRYFLKLDDDDAGFDSALTLPPHRAGPDAYTTAHILKACLAKAPIELLIKWSTGPALLAKVGFGKHRGMKWSDVPIDYLQWIGKSDMTDRDVRATAKHYLKIASARRNAEGANG